MPKWLTALLASLFTAPLIFLLVLVLLMGGSSVGADPIAQIAPLEKMLVYAETASKLGAPWDIVMITDAVYAQRESRGDIEEINPLHTSLQFAIMTVTVEHYQVVASGYDEDGNYWEDWDWVVQRRDTYTALDEIAQALDFGHSDLDALDADGFVQAMIREMQRRSGAEYRYTADLSPNFAVENVLRTYTTLTDEEISRALELYNANYLMERLDAESREQLQQIMSAYGMYQYVDLSNYINCDGVTFSNGATSVTYYNQLDERWADKPYGTDRIGSHACGPTAMAIAISSLTDQVVDPVYMANWSYQHGYWAKNKGTAHSMIPAAAEAFGLTVSGCTAAEPQRIVDALARGDLVVALMVRGHFTSSGHFIVLRGVTEGGKILVADPSSIQRSQRSWDLSIIVNEAHKSAGGGGPFWIISAAHTANDTNDTN